MIRNKKIRQLYFDLQWFALQQIIESQKSCLIFLSIFFEQFQSCFLLSNAAF